MPANGVRRPRKSPTPSIPPMCYTLHMENESSPEANFISVTLDCIPGVNLALQQSALPVVRGLKLKNAAEHDFADLDCSFSSSGSVIEPKTVHLSLLRAGEELALPDPGLVLDVRTLASLSDSLRTDLEVAVTDASGAVLAHAASPVIAYAADQWLGTAVLPGLLAAFVTPNMDAVASLVADTAAELERATGSAAVQGYQAKKDRVYAICAAVYHAIHAWGIAYSEPPASFGGAGQRVRFADAIRKFKLGTCLDTSLLFASVLEQCGLHPVILLQKSHAYVGCHLVDRYFSDLPLEDLQAVRKLVELDEFVVVETTLATGDAPFSEAEARARAEHLATDDGFVCAIDVARARAGGIRPLPLKRSVDGVEIAAADRAGSALADERNRDLRKEIDLAKLAAAAPAVKSRVERWKQKLLDLSLRNRLLNLRDTKQVVTLACSDPLRLEDKLAGKETFGVGALAGLLGEKDLKGLALMRPTDYKDETRELLDKELAQHRLWSPLSPAELRKRLTVLYRQSRTDLEEGGVNTLFLAVGFLEWRVKPEDAESYLAPLLLIPVRLTRASMAEGIRLSRRDEDTVINVTLLELLRAEHGLTIPGLDPLPTDDSGIDVGRVLQIFRQAVKSMKGWEVREDVRLGIFSFSKFIMWNDLTNRLDEIERNPLVKHLAGGGGIFDDGVAAFPPAEVSAHLDPANLFCPVNADASQLAAVAWSALGKTFVLHGPPGTGKSQTITNIIAHNLALGRRVLFVSEKKAALDVVQRRLDAVGLKPFCLELHSNKSGKADVLAQFKESLEVAETAAPADWASAADDVVKARAGLNDYVAALHHVHPDGLSAYRCLSHLFAVPASEPAVSWTAPNDLLAETREDLEASRARVAALAAAFANTVPAARAALLGLVRPADWSPEFERRFAAAAEPLLKATTELRAALRPFDAGSTPTTTPAAEPPRDAAALAAAVKDVRRIPAAFLAPAFTDDLTFLDAFTKDALALADSKAALDSFNLDVARGLDCAGIEARLVTNAQKFFVVRFFADRALCRELAPLKKLGGGPLKAPELAAALPRVRDYQRLQAAQDAGAARASRYAEGTAARTALDALATAGSAFATADAAFAEFRAEDAAAPDAAALEARLRAALDAAPDLRSVLIYLRARGAAADAGLAPFAAALESGTLPPDAAAAAFETAHRRAFLERAVSAAPALRDFIGLGRDEAVRKFCALDDRYTALARQAVFARLAANLPRRRSGPCPEGTELGTLKRECEKRARQHPVRQLLAEIPTLLQTLKPCFLMSPLSVAQYLPPDCPPFDLVVFDEASQIPVWDAVGVVARGKQLIVVGDPKQMPPTSFFQKDGTGTEVDIAPDAPEEDAESILDECLAAGVQSAYLNWHYRSRHESLIAFSNHQYYEDKLFTFPSAGGSARLGVGFQFVPNGVYDRTSTRTNKEEARAVVDWIFARLGPGGELAGKSVGIVTFSMAQRELLEDFVEQRRAKDPRFEDFFNEEKEDPFFVKNLENVQGDERDVILFSVGYGRDAAGHFWMNFGPLNLEGGERRLNVAITRAKERIVVFSSVHATEIDTNRTSARGAADLKAFLDYAEKGVHYLPPAAETDKANGLRDAIAAFLESKGFDVGRDIGASGCRIDLAVKDPAQNGDYLLGIECDGPAYAAPHTVRDRDHLRDSVLRGLGWHLFHAWSVDWAFDPARTGARLLTAIEDAKSGKAEPVTRDENPEGRASGPSRAAPIGKQPSGSSAQPPQATSHKSQAPAHPAYCAWSPAHRGDPASFYDVRTRPTLARQFASAVQVEGPVARGLLQSRIREAWGFTHAGSQIQAILDDCLPRPPSCVITHEGTEEVYWPAGTDPKAYRGFRVPAPDGERRTIDEIPPEELANAMEEVLTDFQSCEPDVLYRETVRLFGFNALTAKMRPFLDAALRIYQARNG